MAAFGNGDTPDLYDRIGGFLRVNGLDPSPANYDFAYRYFSSDDPQLTEAVHSAVERYGRLTEEAIAAISANEGDALTPEAIEEMFLQVQANMAAAVGLVTESRDDAHAYGKALATNVTTIAQGAEDKGRALATLVELTRTMIGKTRDAERRLQEMGEKMDALNGSLAEARETAARDPLTGLANRRAFQARLAAAARAMTAAGKTLTLAFCDIDHFKNINDQHGHDTGDRVLKLVAKCLSDATAENTFVGRHGGEEFLILFEGVESAEAAEHVDAIREGLAARKLVSKSSGQSLGSITFSAGIAEYEPREGVGGMLRRADEALYRAKGAGRNRVVIDPGHRAA